MSPVARALRDRIAEALSQHIAEVLARERASNIAQAIYQRRAGYRTTTSEEDLVRIGCARLRNAPYHVAITDHELERMIADVLLVLELDP